MTEPEPKRIVYVASRWGEPSQTFVRREARAVRNLGVEIHTASLKRPPDRDGEWSPLWLGPIEVITGLIRVLVSRPKATLHVLWTVVRRSSPRNSPNQLVAAAIGLAWVGSKRLPEGHLHTHFGWVAATAAWASATVDDRSFSVMLHAFEIHVQRYQDEFTAIPLRAATNVFVQSDRDQAEVLAMSGVHAAILHMGVPEAWLEPVVGAEKEADLIVTVGRLVDKKGFQILLDALAVSEKPWRLEVIGDGPLESSLSERVERLDLTDRVTLRGSLEEADVRVALRRAAVMSLPCIELASGDRDGVPTVLVEAMASGAAVVTTDAGSIPELVGDTGVIVAQRDRQALAEALDGLWEHDAREDLVHRARARVAADWTVERSAQIVIAATFAEP